MAEITVTIIQQLYLNLLNWEFQVLIDPACFTNWWHLFQFINTTWDYDNNLLNMETQMQN